MLQRLSPEHLLKIELRDDEEPRGPWNPQLVVRSETLQPLTAFKKMEHFYISISTWSFDLDNHLLDHFAQAWPELNVLHLNPEGPWPKQSKITLERLVPLAKGCPDLQNLALTFHADAPGPADMHLPSGGDPNRCMYSFDIGRSTITSATHTTAFLFSIFPEISDWLYWTDLDWNISEERRFSNLWHDVESTLPLYAAVRKQEREFYEEQEEETAEEEKEEGSDGDNGSN